MGIVSRAARLLVETPLVTMGVRVCRVRVCNSDERHLLMLLADVAASIKRVDHTAMTEACLVTCLQQLLLYCVFRASTTS
jgi:hypothetical protein